MAKRDNPSTSSSDLVLSNRTMKALGLKQQPFSTAILSDKNIYTDSILNKQYETLKHHLQFSDLILIVEGIFGSGKTILFRRLFQLDIASLYLMPIQAEATDTLIQIQQKMTIHMQEQGNANYLDDNLKNLQVFDQTPVLLIDDAHVLSDITLQELLRYKQQLAAEKDTHLKLLLLANKGMAKTLEQISDLEHSQLYVQQMPKFSAKQILTFIAHRMKLSGAESLPHLDEARVQKLAKKTDGIPAEVLSAAAELINSLSGKKSILSFHLPSRPVLLGATLIALLAVAGWFLYPVFNPKMADLSGPSPADKQVGIEHEAAAFVDPASADISPADDVDNRNTPGIPEDAIEVKPATVASTPVMQAFKEPLPVPQAEPLAQPGPNKQPLVPTPAPKVVAVPEVKAPAIAPTTKTKSRTNTRFSKAKPNTVKDPALSTLSKLGIKDQDWLLRQNKNHWTLQVLGAREPQTLVNFVRSHRLGRDTAWYKSSLNGDDWYVLVHRFYTDRDIARNSISRLPASLRQARPWVRSIGSIHQAVN